MTYQIEKSFRSIELPCVVIMGSMGHRCGYVGVPETHPLYGVEYNEKTHKLEAYWSLSASQRQVDMDCMMSNLGIIPVFLMLGGHGEVLSPAICIGAHGGLTYSGGSKYPISMENFWWFGYDCGHNGDARDMTVVSDFARGLEEKYPTGGILRTTEYCVYECVKVAEQLRKIEQLYNERKEILFREF